MLELIETVVNWRPVADVPLYAIVFVVGTIGGWFWSAYFGDRK
jgi:hypothetical protein